MTTALIDTGIVLSKRLLLGILPMDALTREDLAFAITIEVEQPQGIKLSKHNSGRFSLAYDAELASPIQIRLFDLQRRYVPRRLSIPVQTLAQILATEAAQTQDYLQSRQRFPVLFPGAAYPINGRATGLRGKVLFDGSPVRWCFVELRSADSQTNVLTRARGDDRGEFLILIPPSAVPDESLNQTVSFEILVYARATPMSENNNQRHDPFWDLPVEAVVDVQPDDLVSVGNVIPTEYVASQTPVLVTFQLSHMLSSHEVDDIVFNPP